MNGIMALTALTAVMMVGSIVALFGGFWLWLHLGKITSKVDRLEKEVDSLHVSREQMERDIHELKGHRLHPYPTREGLEDAIAIANDVIHEAQASIQYTEGRVRQLVHILKVVRADPHAYQDGENCKIPYENRRPNA